MFFVEDTIRLLSQQFSSIPDDRKQVLRTIASFVDQHNPANLIFICTHNSRRSHISQIWAQTAAAWFGISNVNCYSGGTEATAFNPRAVDALRGLGFIIEAKSAGTNPHYLVRYAESQTSIEVFSKKYNDGGNPVDHFAAVMTCTHADENCPIVAGATARISLPYDDPKEFDGTGLESVKYKERSLEIGREILFAFSQINRR